MPRHFACVALVGLLALAGGRVINAHTALILSDPLPGVALGDTPSTVRLTFSERPDAAFSEIVISDLAGVAYQLGSPRPSEGDLLSLYVNIKKLERGIYTVTWRTVSAVDGHATAGSYAFGVRMEPTVAIVSGGTAALSWFEAGARWVLIVGLVGLLGSAAAGLGQFGGGRELTIGAAGSTLSLVGVILLGAAQTMNARASLASLLDTPVGRALLWRAAAIAIATAALVGARKATGRHRAAMMTVAFAGTLAAIAAHVATGHAAADAASVVAAVAQWAHFVAAGIWFGGLAALLLGLGGASSDAKTGAAQRFSFIATIALVLVVTTGLARTVTELTAWADLTRTGYGLTVLTKIALSIGIIALAAVNHWRNVARASVHLTPLRRTAGGELVLAACAFAAAGLLGTLAPPASGSRDPSGLVATGTDFATTLRVRLSTPSNWPGPNRFRVHAVDYDSGKAVSARRISLRFTPLDDPGIASTSLNLAPGPDDSFIGSGANLAFDGRWRITALVERGGDSVEVPMEVETRDPSQFLAIARPAGEARTYRIQLMGAGNVWITPDAERPGHSTVTISCFDQIQDPLTIQTMVMTIRSADGMGREQVLKRVGRNTFVADVEFQPGPNRIAVVARASVGTRLRVILNLSIPSR